MKVCPATEAETCVKTIIDDCPSTMEILSVIDSCDGETTRLQAAKSKLKTLLRQNHGSTKNAEVMQAIEELCALNPTKDAVTSPLLLGEFLAHTSPDFPGRIKNNNGNPNTPPVPDDVVQYTMGRLSFGIFQPHHLVCTIRHVRNSILECPEEHQVDGQKTFSYPIQIDLTIHTPKGDLTASMCHEALCYVLPDHTNRLGVTFRGGTLTPAFAVRSDPKLMKVWEEVFDHAYSKAEAERSFMSSVMQFLLKKMLDLSTPTDASVGNSATKSAKFEMGRSPRGYLDILYLDEEMRITRGNRGTFIVVERVQTKGQRVFPKRVPLN